MSWLETQIRQREYEERIQREKDILAAQAAAREQCYEAAKDAALRAGAIPTDTLQLWWDSIAGHLSTEPAIKVRWFDSDGLASGFIRHNGAGAYALMSSREIVCPAVTDELAGLLSFHEIGHHRDPYRGAALGMELGAWKWAMANAPYWERKFHEDMTRSLVFNVKQADVGTGAALNVGHIVIEIEELISESSFQKAHRPAEAANHAFQIRQFEKTVGGPHPCERQRVCSDNGQASAFYRGQFLCRRCHESILLDWQVAEVKRQRERSRKVEAIARGAR